MTIEEGIVYAQRIYQQQVLELSQKTDSLDVIDELDA
jgi:hypothetical protein